MGVSEIADNLDVFGPGAFGVFDNIELDIVPFIEGPISIAEDGGEMYKDIIRAFAFDEAKAFGIIEPFDFACRHVTHLLFGEQKLASRSRAGKGYADRTG